MEQSGPSHPASHAHVPLAHAPRSEQLPGHAAVGGGGAARGREQLAPAQPGSQTQVPLTQVPRPPHGGPEAVALPLPLQPPSTVVTFCSGTAFAAHAGPAHPASHTHVPLAHAPRPEQLPAQPPAAAGTAQSGPAQPASQTQAAAADALPPPAHEP
jgi:hypothetical protein